MTYNIRLAGMGISTEYADIDFETYSEAGFIFDPLLNKFKGPRGADKKGLPVVGTAVYAEHPSTEILSLAYDLKDGGGKRLWTPEMPLPSDLFAYIARGGIIEAWNCAFERWLWNIVGVNKYGFPPLPFAQLVDAMAKSRAFSLPGRLADAGRVLKIENQKMEDGKRLLDKFSMPRNPTKADTRTRIFPAHDALEASRLYDYNIRDIEAEEEISRLLPDLNEFEFKFWQCDQAINLRGVRIDRKAIRNAIDIVEQAFDKYNRELQTLTGGEVESASEIAKLRAWLAKTQGVSVLTLDADTVDELLKNKSLPAAARRAIEIRSILASASIKKLYAMDNQATSKDRLHDLFIYHSARTGRAAGAGPQPQNLPNHGPDLHLCPSCKHHFGLHTKICPWCYVHGEPKVVEWGTDSMQSSFYCIALSNDLACIESVFSNAIPIISGCLRGMFIPAEGHDFICSDYSAIEAVVLAALAGEEWRMEVFRTHGKIYEMSAAKITGVPFEDFIKHKAETGQHHPLRKSVGKVAELASGYGGWIGAWKQFGADEFFNDEQMKDAILAWRNASPSIVRMWGSQPKGYSAQFVGLEGAALQAVMYPGEIYKYRNVEYFVKTNVLYCKLPSGRYIAYHNPRVKQSQRRLGTFELSFEGWNTNPKNGAIGWITMTTYGGKLTENVVQAVARDILANAIVNLEAAGYPIVMHVHDEIVAEVPEGFGSIEEFEKIMSTLPEWAKDWPVKASGGWRGKRYCK